MSFCTNCGNELPLDVKFCPKCGTQMYYETQYQDAINTPYNSTKTADIPQKKRTNKRLMFILLSAVAIIVIALLLFNRNNGIPDKVQQLLEDDLNTSVKIIELYYNEEKQGYYVEFVSNNTSDAAAIHLDTGKIDYKSEYNYYAKKAEALRKENPINESELHKYNQLIINSSIPEWGFSIAVMKNDGKTEYLGWKKLV